MLGSLNHSPGQTVTLFFQLLNSNFERVDGYANPKIERIILPNLNIASGYPVEMTKLDTGLFYYKFTLLPGATYVGSYLVDISWIDPDSAVEKKDFYQIVVTAPLGNYSFSAG